MAGLFGTMLLLSVAPGPSDFAVVARSMTSGFVHALIMVGGIIIADFLFILLAVFSLAALAETFDALFVLVKTVCGVYLIYLGVTSIRAKPVAAQQSAGHESSRFASFMTGLLITLGDPKAILFYMGLFPAFVDLPTISMADTLVIMLIATMIVGGVKTAYAYLADRARLFFQHKRASLILDRLAGGLLAGIGVLLLLQIKYPL